jgi:hypothetical protein
MFKKLSYAALIAVTAVAFVIGSAATGEAKGKKKKAAPPPPPMCAFVQKSVCAVKGGHKYTYANSCFAAKDGAKIVSQKACPVKKAKKAKKAKKKKHKKKSKKMKK